MVRGASRSVGRRDGEPVRARRGARRVAPHRDSFRPSDDNWGQYLGRKISIRYALHGDPDHPFSEAVGVVQSTTGEGDASELRVVTKKRGTVAVPTADVLALKVFP